jgi:hypothetical protein
MPLIGSTAYNTLGQVTALVRSLLNDAAGNVYTDSVLLNYANSAYRRVQRKLANTGSNLFITDDVLLIVAAIPAAQQDPSTQTVINDATAAPNQLPANLLAPKKIWERPNGTTQDFVEMVDLTSHGGLPSRLQGFTLDEWEWRTDGIYFVGATQDTQIRLRYTSALPDLVGPTDVILIRNSQEALAYGTAAAAANARGSELAVKFDAAAEDSIEDLVGFYIRAQQNSGVRRRPFSSRGGNQSYGRRIW